MRKWGNLKNPNIQQGNYVASDKYSASSWQIHLQTPFHQSLF
jgi:hypothetical protein